ncbi:carbamoyltransferase C-terminal domain-containing protein [Ferrovibrio sp.]|uniref:carbamoyltransferase C-terminal domain-containing protein n=1 Tax=Ferrovibrio sp. TaxID=1917215 RepID=UPI0031203312
MIILGIHDGHDAHACIVRDGQLVALIGEERLSRLKSDGGYPRRAIDAVLQMAKVTPAEVDVVAFTQRSDWIWRTLLNKYATFKVADWVRECDVYWRPLLLEKKKMSQIVLFDEFRDVPKDVESRPYYRMVDRIRDVPAERWSDIGDQVRREVLQEHLGISGDKMRIYRHEDCHKAYGFYSSPYPRDRTLVFTLEGGGQDSSATTSIFEPDGSFTELWKSNAVNAGRLYAYVTLILGMQPGQHEYKVMGLAPYGNEYHGRRSLEFFRKVNRVVGEEIVNDGLVPELYFFVREALRAERFDGIAWGLQTWLEELVTTWVGNTVRKHGIDNVVLSGGVGQNIKIVKALAEQPSIRQVWAPPISGDGSLGVGAAWLASRDLDPGSDIQSLSSIYLGTSYGIGEIDHAISRAGLAGKYHVQQNPTAAQVARWLVDGKIVARFSGRMEFGQRALGNRSILADPRHAETIDHVNQKIKYRDFWMPFTPSMTQAQAEKMLVNPKGLYSPFMTMAFDLAEEFRGAIPAATHPADGTVRPQMLRRTDNPGYYAIMEEFGRLAGVECVMNTSFNLHGEAIVESPDDAISTFLRSDLDVLLFDHVAILR